MNQSLIPVTFHDDTLYLVEHNHEPYTPARPICDALGIDWGRQSTKLKEPRWKCWLMPTVAQDGKKREMLCLPLRKLPGWLMSISPAKVKPEVREKLERYQDECDEVLWRYWNGQVVKKAQPEEPPKPLPHATKAQREPLVKAIRRVVKVAEARGRKLGYDEAHAIVNLRLGIESLEQLTPDQIPQAMAVAGELLEKVVLEGEYIPAGEGGRSVAAPAPEAAGGEPLSFRQREELAHAMAAAVAGLGSQGGAREHVANRLRVLCRVRSLAELTTAHLPVIEEELERIREDLSNFLAFRAELREFINREVIGAGLPWTPAVARRWRKEMKGRLPERPDWLREALVVQGLPCPLCGESHGKAAA